MASGLFTGQIGYAWNAALLVPEGRRGGDEPTAAFINTVAGVGLASASATRWGGTVGVGFEYGFSPNWSAGIEYDHIFMGNSNNTFSIVNPLACRSPPTAISQDVDMVTAAHELSLRLGQPGRRPLLIFPDLRRTEAPASSGAFLLSSIVSRTRGAPSYPSRIGTNHQPKSLIALT